MTSSREFDNEFSRGGNMDRTKGFTMIEILVTILILGVLAAVTIPGFTKAKTKAEKDQAVAYLRTVRTSMRMYYGKWKTYLPLANTGAIKSTLGAETQAAGYGFSVAAPTTSTFTATAFRSADSKTITLNQDGTWGGDIPPPS
ncbi:MAG: type II secretion system protein [Candidatus Omnitrophota bacterium]